MAAGSVRDVSTPPFIDPPEGVTVEAWQVGGSRRAVMHAGLAGARSWVVLVPGFTGSKEDFIAVLPLLAASGVGVVALDQLGQYESDASDDPSDYALDLLARDVAELIAVAGTRFGVESAPHLVGHSFGGLVVQEAVAGGHVVPASLVLLCTGPGALPPERWEQLPALVDALEVHDLATIWRIMAAMAEAEAAHDDAGAADMPSPDVQAFLERRWHANSAVQLREVARLLMGQPVITDRLRDVVARVGPGGDLPVSVVWGELDDAWPVEVQAEMATRLDAAAVALPGLGHSPNAEDPTVTATVLLRAWGH